MIERISQLVDDYPLAIKISLFLRDQTAYVESGKGSVVLSPNFWSQLLADLLEKKSRINHFSAREFWASFFVKCGLILWALPFLSAAIFGLIIIRILELQKKVISLSSNSATSLGR